MELLPAPDVKFIVSEDKRDYTASWLTLDGAKAYRYQIAKDSNFDQLVSSNTTEQQLISLNDLATGTYYLTVRGIDQFSLEGLDSTMRVEKREIPELPEEEKDDYWKIIMSIGLLILVL